MTHHPEREKELLIKSLDAQRRHVLGILDGLSDENLRRAVLPSGWSCIGLVQHLALDVERFWFTEVTEGDRSQGESEGDETSAWVVPDGTDPEAVLELYRSEMERANTVIRATPLDVPPAWWPDMWPNWRMETPAQTILHVIAETACHAGHLDAVRELIDGRTWMVLD